MTAEAILYIFSLLADVPWGSFVTHSFLPQWKKSCVGDWVKHESWAHSRFIQRAILFKMMALDSLDYKKETALKSALNCSVGRGEEW